MFTSAAESALQAAYSLHRRTHAFGRLASMLRAIESDTNLVTTEAVHLVQFVQPSFLLVYEANPPGPTRVAVVFTIGDDEIVVQDITLS